MYILCFLLRIIHLTLTAPRHFYGKGFCTPIMTIYSPNWNPMGTYTKHNHCLALFKPKVCNENIVENTMENNILTVESAGLYINPLRTGNRNTEFPHIFQTSCFHIGNCKICTHETYSFHSQIFMSPQYAHSVSKFEADFGLNTHPLGFGLFTPSS